MNSDAHKHILIYAHYYVPDVAATGQILRELAEGFKKELNVTVLCVVPSYDGKVEDKYKEQRFFREVIDGVEVLRIRVPGFYKEHKLSRIRNILFYYFGAKAATKIIRDVDYVFAISQPPILGGMLGRYGKRVHHAKLIYNIQDFNPEQIEAVGYFKAKPLIKLLMGIDCRNCKKSDLVITVGRDLVDTMHNRFPNGLPTKVRCINNWTDEKKIYPLMSDDEKMRKFRRKYGLENKFVIMYSGNIGLYYDLQNIIRVIKRFRVGINKDGVREKGIFSAEGREIVFAFVGDGGVRSTLQDYVERHHIENVVFIPYQKAEDLNVSLNSADVHLCVSALGIKGVSCPSKAYGIMSAGKPMIGIMEQGAEIRCLIEECGCGVCCEPGDYDKIAELIYKISKVPDKQLKEMGMKGRSYLVNNLTMEKSVRKYLEAINSL